MNHINKPDMLLYQPQVSFFLYLHVQYPSTQYLFLYHRLFLFKYPLYHHLQALQPQGCHYQHPQSIHLIKYSLLLRYSQIFLLYAASSVVPTNILPFLLISQVYHRHPFFQTFLHLHNIKSYIISFNVLILAFSDRPIYARPPSSLYIQGLIM